MKRSVAKFTDCGRTSVAELYLSCAKMNGMHSIRQSWTGCQSFEGLKARAEPVKFGERELRIACLADIIKSKRPPNATATEGRARLSRKTLTNKTKG